VESEKPRIEVAHAPTRCPYCHEGVDPDATGWLACAHCLARHHDECWNETGRCGSCARTEALGRVATKAVPKPQPPAWAPTERAPPRETSPFAQKLLIGFSLLPFVVGGFAIAPSETAVFLALAVIAITIAAIGQRASG
jgi:hypothetical protein